MLLGLYWNSGKENANYRDYRVPIVTLRPLKVVDPKSCGLCISHGMGGTSQGSMIVHSEASSLPGIITPIIRIVVLWGLYWGPPFREVTI